MYSLRMCTRSGYESLITISQDSQFTTCRTWHEGEGVKWWNNTVVQEPAGAGLSSSSFFRRWKERAQTKKCAGPALGASIGTGTFQSELIRLWTGEKLGIAADLISTPRHPGHSPPPLSSWTRPQHSGANPLFCGHGIIRRVTNLFWIFLPFSPVFMPAAT